MTREEVLKKALEAVNGTRRENYGSVEDSYQRIASYWSTYLNKDVSPKDVANMMILMKVARLTGVPGNTDTYVDIAGYAACGGEISAGKMEYEEPALEVGKADLTIQLTPREQYIVDSLKL